MNVLRMLLRALLVFVTLMVVQAVAGMLIPMKATTGFSPKWWILNNALLAVTLTFIAARASWRGWRLALPLCIIPLAVQTVNLIEGAFFLKNAGLDVPRLLGMSILGYALAFPLLVLIFRGAPTTAESPREASIPLSGKIWRFAVCDLSYVLLYYTAGMIIFPYVRDFYATQHLPSHGQILAMQELLRAPVFIGVCLLLRKMLRFPRLGTAVGVGLVFTIISGVIPLMSPNPFFPDAVRWAHFGEVVSENFVFGAIIGWLWTTRAPALQAVAQAA